MYKRQGVPFGEVSIVKNWLNIRGEVKKPEQEHPKKPIEGIEGCRRTEVSGKRFWNFIKSICDTPESFSKNCIVYNHCPLIFMGKTGKNITPPDMKKIELRKNLFKHCDDALKCPICTLAKNPSSCGRKNSVPVKILDSLMPLRELAVKQKSL